MRITKLVCLTALILPLLLSACAGDKTRHYPGPSLPQEQVAVIKGTDHFFVFGDYGVDLISVDGSEVGDDSVEVLPGKHTVKVEAYSGAGTIVAISGHQEVRFVALAGHTYEIDTEFLGGAISW